MPGWIAGDSDADLTMATRVLTEHLQLRAGARGLRSPGFTVEQLHELGAALERQVRFEERELFPRIESGLDDEAIAELGDAIAQAEASGW